MQDQLNNYLASTTNKKKVRDNAYPGYPERLFKSSGYQYWAI